LELYLQALKTKAEKFVEKQQRKGGWEQIKQQLEHKLQLQQLQQQQNAGGRGSVEASSSAAVAAAGGGGRGSSIADPAVDASVLGSEHSADSSNRRRLCSPDVELLLRYYVYHTRWISKKPQSPKYDGALLALKAEEVLGLRSLRFFSATAAVQQQATGATAADNSATAAVQQQAAGATAADNSAAAAVQQQATA
jgi:hypothetical protein